MEKKLPKDNKSSDKSNDSANEVSLQRVRTYEEDLKSATKGHSAEEVQPIVKQQSDKKLNEKKIEKIKEQTRRQEARKLAREAREKRKQEKREAEETRRKAKETRKKEKRAQKEARKQAWIDAKLAKKKAEEDIKKAEAEKIIADRKAKEDAKQKAIEEEALAIKQKKEAEEAERLKKEQERLAMEEEKKRKLEQERLAIEQENARKIEEAKRLEEEKRLAEEKLKAEEARQIEEEKRKIEQEKAEQAIRLQKEQEAIAIKQAGDLEKKRKEEEERAVAKSEEARQIEEEVQRAKLAREKKATADALANQIKTPTEVVPPVVQAQPAFTAPKIAITPELPKKKWFRLQEKTNVRAPKQLENREKEDHKKEILIGAVTLVVIGLIIIIFISIFSKDKSPLPTIVVDPSNILDTLVVAKIDTTDKTNAELITLIKEQLTRDVQENTLNEITLTEQVNVAGKNTEKRINSAKLLSILETRLSGRLSRSLAEDAVIGYYEGTENSPFILIKIDDFQNAFAGMLEWENLIVDDVSKIFNKVAAYKENLKPESQSISFKDKVIKNTDARVVKDEFENVKFFYMFLDNGNYLLLADDEYATEVIINELRNRRLVK